MNQTNARPIMLPALIVFALACLAVCPFIGMEHIGPGALFGEDPAADGARTIFWQIRVPRVTIGFLAGAGLAACGMAFQAMFRNALATPFTLGVAGGASLGAALYVRAGLSFAVLSVSGISIFAFLGALGSICLVYGLTRLRRGFSTATMLLAGIAVNLFFSSLILFIQYMSDFTHSFQILRWLMGGLEVMGYESVLNLAPMVAAGVLVLFALTHELNLMTVGEELAISRGANVHRIKRVLFLATSVCVGGVVAVCGPIGFVGMMAPHICRLLVGSNHRVLLPACCFFGGAFMVLCDAAARTLIAPAEIPVGVITSVLGGPFFIWLLVRSPSSGLILGGARH
jgi:iron complex transport system permease protein